MKILINKPLTKLLFLISIFSLFFLQDISAQTITVGGVDPGPYSQGSTIVVPININDAGGCISQNNTFNVYLSDASGNFSPGTLIGSYAGFYAGFVNATIPNGTPAGPGYKVEVQSTSPAVTSSVSSAFAINNNAGVTASVSSTPVGADPNVFGRCVGISGATFSIKNTSSAGTTTASFFNEKTQGYEGSNIPIPTTGYTFTAATSNYTITVKNVDGSGNVATQGYQLINNIIQNNFGSAGNGFVCLSSGQGVLSYTIATNGPSGISANYPGNTYVVNWGDGTSTTFTVCQIAALGGVVSHTFTLPSCGQTGNGVANSFYVQNQAFSPYCGEVSAPPGISAKVLITPITSFTAPAIACSGTALTIPNTSQPGPDPNATTSTCTANPGALYDWTLDGVSVVGYQAVPLGTSFVFPAGTTSGTHTLTLHSELPASGIGCQAADYTQTICFEQPPQPAFTIAPEACAGTTVTPVNTSVAANICSVATYAWTVTGPRTVTYTGGTTSASQTPQFVFPVAGTYTVQLGMLSGCGTITTTQTINIDGNPVASLSPALTLCGSGQTLTFDPTQTVTKTTFSGTTVQQPTTYTWVVTGGAYSFVGGTNANSEYPQILFNDIATYTVTVTNQNTCGSTFAQQNITFGQAPIVNAGPDQTVCASSPAATLAGSVTGTYSSYQWVGGAGVFSPGRNVLNPVYTPSSGEIAAGSVTLTLQGNASIPPPCDVATGNVVINFTPTPAVTSAPAAAVCSAQALSYTITANQPLTTFTWTASATTGTPTGFTAAGSGSIIADVISNTGITDAVVTYLITPTLKGCPGNVFTLNVTIHPLPTVTATPVVSPICSNQPANIVLASNVANTTYTWTSTASAGITGNTSQSTANIALSIQDVLVNTNVNPGTVTYTITPYNGTCAGPNVIASITVEPSPVISNAGPNTEICNATSYTLQGNNPSPGTGVWTVTSGPGTISFSDATNPNAVVSGLIPGNIYQFQWTTSYYSNCPSSSSIVKITDDTPPVGGITTGANEVCSGSGGGSITLSGQSGTILQWESSIDGGVTWQPIANTTTIQPYSNLTQSTQYRAVIHNGVCTDAPSTATLIKVDAPPVASNPGPNDEVCGVTTYTLQGNNPSPGTGMWTLAGGPGTITFSNPTDPNAVVSGLIPGNIYQFQWTITATGACPINSNTVTITVDKTPVGGTTSSPAEVCTGSNNGQITLTGQFGAVVRWESSIDGGSTWVPITNTGINQSYTNLTQTTQYRAILHNGNICTDVPSTATTITVDTPPVTANAGPADEVCNVTTYTLQGNNPSPGTGAWTLVSGPHGAVFSDPTNPNAVVSNLIPGSAYQFQWTIQNTGVCAPSTNTVNIVVDKPPVGGSTSGAATVCTGSNAGQVTLAGQFGAVVRWESSIDGGTTWQPIVNTSASQSYLNLTQTTEYRAVLGNGVCADVNSTPTTITVMPLPVTSVPGANDEVCNITTYTLQGNNPSPGTGLWTVLSGPAGAVFSDPANPNATVSGLTPGIYQFQWTITGASSCPSSSNSVTITVDQPPVGGTTSSNATVCIGSNGGQITLTGQFGTIVRWEMSVDNGTTWQTIANSGTTQSYSNLTQTTQYRAILHNSTTCADIASTITVITVAPNPIVAVAGANDEVCGVTSYGLNGNNPSPGTGLWTEISGPAGVTFSDATNPGAIANGLIPGSVYQFQWTITTSASCPSTSSAVMITIDKPPVGGTATANPSEVCFGSNAGQVTLSGQFGTIFGWQMSTDNGATWQPIGNSTATQSFTNLSQNTEYRAILHNSNTCADVFSSPAIVTVDPMPVVSNPGPDAEVCNVTSYTLQGNNPSLGTGNWTITQGPAGATFSDATNPNAMVSGLIPGNIYQFKWTITSSPTSSCPPSSNTVNITIDAPAIGGTTSGAAEICMGSNGGTITLSGQVGTVTQWESSVDNGVTWQPIANATTSLSYLNLTQTTQYRADVRNGSTCPGVTSTPTTIIVDPPPTTANAGPDDEVCSVTAYTLHGNSPVTGTGNWTVNNGPAGATFSDATNPNAIVSGLIPGNIYQFKWTITSAASCPPSSSTVNVTIDQAPVGGTTSSPAVVCSGSNSGQITLAGQFGTIIRWEYSTDNGTTWQPIVNTGTTQSYANLTQTTAYRAVLHNSSTCADVTSTITTITVDLPPPVANAGTDAEVCGVTTYTLQGNSPGTGTGLWIVAGGPAGATFVDATNPNTVVNGLVPGSVYQFKWAITGSASCPASSSTVNITIDKAPIGGTTSSPAEVCSGSNTGQINLSGQFGTIVRWESSVDGGATWLAISNTTTAQAYFNLTTTTQYRAVLHNSATCADVTSTATMITVDQPPVVADAGADDEVCSATTYTLNGNSPGAGTGKWTVFNGPAGATFSDATIPNAVVSGLIPGNVYQFEWTITGTASCPPTTDLVAITVDKAPIGGTASGAAEVCSGSNNGQVTLSGQFGTVVRWELSTDNGAIWQPIANTNNIQPYSNLTQTTQYRAILHNSNTCADVPSAATTITVDTPPVQADAGADAEICGATSYTLNGNIPAPGTGQWTVLTGPAGVTFSDPASPAAVASGMIPGNVYEFQWTITGTASCPPTTDIVSITDDKAASGGSTTGATQVCSANNAGDISLSGEYGNIIRWDFSIDNGATWQPLANTTHTQHYSNLTQTTEYRGIVQNGTICGPVFSTVTTIIVNPPPVTSVPGPDDVVCSVTTYTLHGNNPAPGTGMWSVAQGPAGVTFSDPTNPDAIVNGLIPGNIYTFKWAITGSASCPPNSAVVTITVDQAPVGGTTSSPATVCWGSNAGQIALTGQFGTIVSWESSIDNGASWQPIANSTTSQTYLNLTVTTQYRAILHNGTSCADVPSTVTTITVNDLTPVSQAGQDFSVCNQTVITLNGNSPGTGGGAWTQTAGPAVNIVSPSNYSTEVTGLAGDTTYTFKWTLFGLPSCGNTESTVNVSVHTDIVPSFTMDKSNGCGPTTVTFTNTSTPTPQGTFVWNFGDGSPSVTATNPPAHTFSPSSDGTEKTYEISLTPLSNCGSQTPFVASVTVSSSVPVAALLPSQAGSCGTFTLTAKNLSPGDNVKYDFYLTDQSGAILQHLSYTDKEDAVFQPVSPTQPATYELYMTVTDKCGNQAKSTPVEILGAPSALTSQVQIKGNIRSVCLGSPVTFQNISTGGDTFTITVYDAGKNPILTIPSGTADLNYTPTAIGTYYVSITAGYAACGNAPVSALIDFTVFPIPQPNFSYTSDEYYNVTFVNKTPDAGRVPAPSLIYNWDFGDGSPNESSFEPNIHHFDFAKSPFTVTLTATTPGASCFGIATQTLDIQFHGNIFVPNAMMPTSSNPEHRKFFVKGYGMKAWHIQVFNNFGQMVWESTALDSNGSPTESWDGTYKGKIVEQGVYIWQISGTLLNGEEWKGMSYNNGPPSRTGPIHLIR